MTNEQLVIRIKTGIDVAENMLQLWNQCKNFIGMLASKYKSYEDEEDLKQQGYIGLCDAVDHYDPDGKVSFIHYASFWIRQSMVHYIKECGSVVRLPGTVKSGIGQYKKYITTFQLWFGKMPNDAEKCYHLQIDKEKLKRIENALVFDDMGSLDIPIGEEAEGSLYELLPGGENPEEEVTERVQWEQLQETLWKMVEELPNDQPEILRLRYQNEKTLQEVGEQLGKTVGQVRSLEAKALRALREPEKADTLKMLRDGEIYSKATKGNGIGCFKRTWTSSTEYVALRLWEK